MQQENIPIKVGLLELLYGSHHTSLLPQCLGMLDE